VSDKKSEFLNECIALGELLLDIPRRPEVHIGQDGNLRDRDRVRGTRNLDDFW
jgi:hypothetical protein